MMWARGFFRLWVALSVAWAVYVAATVSSGWENSRNWLIVSELCTQFTKRGDELLLSYELDEILETGRQAKYPHALRVSVPEVIACERDNRFEANLRIAQEVVFEGGALLILPPLIVLCLGMILGWIFSGVRAGGAA
jgi:hypothetical protein